MATKTKAQLLEEAQALGLEVTENNTVKEIQAAVDQATPEVEPVEEVASEPTPTPKPASEGSDIASAIREGLAGVTEKKKIKITADKNVQARFTVVKSKKTGEIMIRENATGKISKVQTHSLEEKEALTQNEEVEEL